MGYNFCFCGKEAQEFGLCAECALLVDARVDHHRAVADAYDDAPREKPDHDAASEYCRWSVRVEYTESELKAAPGLMNLIACYEDLQRRLEDAEKRLHPLLEVSIEPEVVEKYPRVWEDVADDMVRLRVFGGWIVWCTGNSGTSGNLIFLPDPDYRWVLEEE